MSPYRDVLLADHYHVRLEWTANPTLSDLERAYDSVSDLWDESKYLLELHESLRKTRPFAGDKIVFLKKFKDATPEKMIEWARCNNYRLAFPCEREAFSKANPDLQLKFWIADLGSFVVCRGVRYVPVLNRYEGVRHLGEFSYFGECEAYDRFLLVRE